MRFLFLFVMSFPLISMADDIKDSIKKGLTYYEGGKYNKAVESLGHASKLMQQKTRTVLQQFLPKALSGWTSHESNSELIGAAMFGGGVTAERGYNNEGKGIASKVTIRIIANSPIMESVMMMYSTPGYAEASGKKLEIIKGNKAIIEFDAVDGFGNINIVVANRFLVQIEGDARNVNGLKQYAKLINYKKLAALTL